MELITLRSITKTYQMGDISVPVLKGISLSIRQGELIALTGSSGSGKSTLMNILGCLDRPTDGEYWLDGQETSTLSADERALLRNSKLGFVFQSFNLLARTSAIENVAMPLSYAAEDLSEREAKDRAAEMLVRVGLGDRMDHLPSQLSGGQQQRVAIARSMANQPAILLCDEPTANLDLHTGQEILRILQRVNRERHVTVICATHD
ncbi:MAG: ABC transporter ATP-binding protein, partial [Proteobacteria bacterium]|nr:ABC transporter ATP-binding protein [Pseudomonadota bacterium]